MPCRNIVKRYDVNSYYHVYNRGVEKRSIFLDDEDYSVFLNLLKRYLSDQPEKDKRGREYNCLADKIEMTTFCLMPNHFHLLLYQLELDSVTKLMRPVCSSYTSYFNKKYDRVGPLFQGNFKASRISNDSYLAHISRYIHRNPKKYLTWDWSSLQYWLGGKHSEWVKPDRVNDMTPARYMDFINDQDDFESSLDEIESLTIDE